jgi:hypothetical protein
MPSRRTSKPLNMVATILEQIAAHLKGSRFSVGGHNKASAAALVEGIFTVEAPGILMDIKFRHWPKALNVFVRACN